MQKFLKEFEEYCKTPGVDSGKARSYAKAIEYLCDFLSITVIDVRAIAYLKSIENNIKDKNSALYKELLAFLARRGQRSYLNKGWIRAALSYFFKFVDVR